MAVGGEPSGLQRRWATVAICAAALLAVANAALFTWAAAGPLIASDNWTFIETFLRPALERSPGLGDFLVKRSGLDHGQPLNKALMLLNARYFGLDFRIEAMIGIAFAALGLGVLLWSTLARTQWRHLCDPGVLAAAICICAVYLSLNSSMIYSHSMVTMGFADYVFAFLVIDRAWRQLQGGSPLWLGLAMFVYGIVGDNSAVLTGVALSGAALLAGWKLGDLRRSLVVVATVFAALVAAHLIYAMFGEVRGVAVTPFNATAGERLQALWAQMGDAWKWVVIPAASGLAYMQSLQFFFPEHWRAVQIAVALAVIAGHVWFWHAALHSKQNAVCLFAVALMLLFYLYVAGLLYGRAYLAGADYLDQPRYVSLYQFQIIAMLLMAISARNERDSEARNVNRRFVAPRAAGIVTVAIAIMALQWPLTHHAWVEAKYLQPYYRGMAAQFGAVARSPTAPPPAECAPFLLICKMPPETRASTMAFLRAQRLSLYSPKFAAAHPELAEAAGLQPVVNR